MMVNDFFLGLGCGLIVSALGWIVLYRRGTRAAVESAFKSQSIATLESEKVRLSEENQRLERELGTLRTAQLELNTALARAQEQVASAERRISDLATVHKTATEQFKLLSAEALKSNNQAFLEIAQSTLNQVHERAAEQLVSREQAIAGLVAPVQQSLERFNQQVAQIEKDRVGAYESLTQQVRSMLETQVQLRGETANLVKALRNPNTRGRWGELQLKRVVEMAGMADHCDFYEQVNVNDEEARLRPDMIIRMPGGKTIVVDAKAPLSGYLEALEATDEIRRLDRLRAHARHIREHAVALGRKSYWEQFEHSPEFVVLFIPGESFFTAALEQEPQLIEQAVAERVLLATPMTLIALLKAASFGWRQERIAESSAEIQQLGQELHERLVTMSEHISNVGSRLGQAVDSYNKAVQSLEHRVMVSARKFEVLGAASPRKSLPVLEPIDHVPRAI